VSRRRLLQYAGIGAGVVVVLGVAAAAFVSLKVPFDTTPSGGSSTEACQPQPCANVRGFILWVTDLKTDGRLVTMQLRFQNSSSSTHADPADISLTDSQNAGNTPVYDAPGCTHWPRTEFNNSATFGPVPECFRPFSTAPPLRLRWTPDFGPFCCETEISLE
jgi:hypothetical protein